MHGSIIYYFGCWQASGHYLYNQDLRRTGYHGEQSLPFRLHILDAGLLATDPYQVEGQAHHAVINAGPTAWSIVSFWDRTGDRRGSSNSAFIMNGHFTFNEVIERAKQVFPKLFERFTFEIKMKGTL